MRKFFEFIKRWVPYAAPLADCGREVAAGVRAIADHRCLQLQFFGMGGAYFASLAMADGDGGGQAGRLAVTVTFVLIELGLATQLSGKARMAAQAFAGVFAVLAFCLVTLILAGVR